MLRDGGDAASRAKIFSTVAELFEDASASHQQSGKFKLEGCWRQGYFRSSKAYYLDQQCSPEEIATEEAEPPSLEPAARPTIRMRSIPRKLHHKLSLDHFSQDPLCNRAAMRTTLMRPTPGFEMVMMRQSRWLSHAINGKRHMVVRPKVTFSVPPPPEF